MYVTRQVAIVLSALLHLLNVTFTDDDSADEGASLSQRRLSAGVNQLRTYSERRRDLWRVWAWTWAWAWAWA